MLAPKTSIVKNRTSHRSDVSWRLACMVHRFNHYDLRCNCLPHPFPELFVTPQSKYIRKLEDAEDPCAIIYLTQLCSFLVNPLLSYSSFCPVLFPHNQCTFVGRSNASPKGSIEHTTFGVLDIPHLIRGRVLGSN